MPFSNTMAAVMPYRLISSDRVGGKQVPLTAQIEFVCSENRAPTPKPGKGLYFHKRVLFRSTEYIFMNV